MSDEQAERLITVLEQIAAHLAVMAYPWVTTTAPAQTTTAAGYTCPVCHGFVSFGTLHTCAGRAW